MVAEETAAAAVGLVGHAKVERRWAQAKREKEGAETRNIDPTAAAAAIARQWTEL